MPPNALFNIALVTCIVSHLQATAATRIMSFA